MTVAMIMAGCSKGSEGSNGGSTGSSDAAMTEADGGAQAGTGEVNTDSSANAAAPVTGAGENGRTETQAAEDAGLTYEDLEDITFNFSSGAGGWGTELFISADGSFSGSYHDSEMGEVYDDAPHGSVYLAVFEGSFGELTKVNEYTYAASVTSLSYKNETGTEETKDQIRYKYTDAYGMTGSGKFLFYLPEALVKELPEEYISWVRMAMNYEEREQLGFYGIYNEAGDAGFSGFKESAGVAGDSVAVAALMKKLKATEEEGRRLETLIKEDHPQQELNSYAADLYNVWDTLLNEIWVYLKQTLDEDTMKKLTKEQIKWIDEKEAAVARETAPYEGGSIVPLIAGTTAADITKDRVYELMEYVR